MFLDSLVVLIFLQVCASDWTKEWMAPIRDQMDEDAPFRRNDMILKDVEDQYRIMAPAGEENSADVAAPKEKPTAGLKIKLTNTLTNAKKLAETLKQKVEVYTAKEKALKAAITGGRSGVSTVTVHTMNQQPRSYIIRDRVWSLCTGIIQTPASQGSFNLFNGIFAAPKCIGQEVLVSPDPCAFNSLIKYETLPAQRRIQYVEDDYFCLTDNFNNTVERYLSVPKRLINETCRSGIVRSLDDNIMECSLRMLSEYNYYPERGISSRQSIPLEYCVESDGSCKLIVAWHIANDTVENFEFLKNEPNFKKFFIKSEL